MTSTKFNRFLDYLQSRKLMTEHQFRRSVHQYGAFDRRLGQLGTFLGYIQPEQINEILLQQSQNGGRFGECAVQLKMMTPQQVDRLVNLQRDDMAIFAQAVGIQNAAASVEFTSYLTEFLRDNPAADASSAETDATNLHEHIRAILNRVEHIAPLPGTVERVVALLDNPEVNLDEIAQVLKMDPALTATLLRVSNSAFYGLRSKIGSTKKALQVMGTDKLRQLVIVAGIMQKFHEIPQEFAMKFWENALRTAECSKEIGKYCRISELDELFVCGLLHNIGELVTKQFFPGELGEIEKLVGEKKKNRMGAEKHVMGGTHADVGGFLFHIWKLPRTTTQCAMFHHHDFPLLVHTPNLAEEVYIVHMAATLCHLDSNLDAFSYSKALDAIGEYYGKRLKFSGILDINNLMTRVDASIEQIDKNYFK